MTSLTGLGRLTCLEEVLRHVRFLGGRRCLVVEDLAARLAYSKLMIVYADDCAAVAFHMMRSGDKIDSKIGIVFSI